MNEKDVVLKAWEVFQGLSQGLGDSCWKIRSVFYTASSALIAYGFVHNEPLLYGGVVVLAAVFFILEAGYKQVQNQYIAKSLAIERTLNDLLVGEEEPFLPAAGISTSITTPTLVKCFMIWRGNLLFWSPYLVIPVVALLLWAFNVRGHETTPKVALVSDSSIDAKNKPAVVQSVPTADWQKQWTRMADSLDSLVKQMAAVDASHGDQPADKTGANKPVERAEAAASAATESARRAKDSATSAEAAAIAARAATGNVPTPPASGRKQVVAGDIVEIQRGLKRLGYDPGDDDGIPGPNTRKAVRLFCRQAQIRYRSLSGRAFLEELNKRLSQLPSEP